MSGEAFQYDTTKEKLIIRAAMGATAEQLTELVAAMESGDFLDPQHQKIWQALVQLNQRGQSYQMGGELEGADRSYVAELETMVCPPETCLRWYLNTLRWDVSRARFLGQIASGTPDEVKHAAQVLLEVLDREGFKSDFLAPCGQPKKCS